jgi:peptide/nickel transport system permease protein
MSKILAARIRELPIASGNRHVAWFFRRAIGGAAVLWAVTTFTFIVQALMPGDRALLIINMAAGNITNPSQAEIDAVNAEYGFTDPIAVQYLNYLWRLLHGDFGVSYQLHRPVIEIVGAQILPTIVLAFSALLTAWFIAIFMTVVLAGRANPWSRFVSGLQIVMATMPPYWIGTILLVTFAVYLRIFPVEGKNSLIGLVLPTLALAIPLAGFIGLVIQQEFVRVLEQPFVTSSRARGMGDFGVRLRHVLRHAVLPGVTLSGWAVGSLFSGAVLVETVFARQGIGGILVTATSARDVPLVTGITVISAGIYVIANILVDRAYLIIDPRIKLA